MTEQPAAFHILALETSCDETAAAVVRNGTVIVSNVVASQMEMHERYGGVVPEVASRQHILSLLPVLQEAVAALPGSWNDIHAIAATYGPGLSGALITGLNAAKAIAWQRQLLFVGVNHLEAHIYANWLQTEEQTPPPQFPLVALVVSGGHTLLALLRDHGDYQLLGQTRDDAAGEAFDKVARILGLGYPGGPAVEHSAKQAIGGKLTFPRAWLRDSYDFSFSGLKTAVLHKVQERESPGASAPTESQKRTRRGRKSATDEPAEAPAAPPPARSSSTMPDGSATAHMAHAFQESVVDVLVSKTVQAAAEYGAAEIVLAGGVSANMRLREEMGRRAGVPVRCPPIWLCTDNAAMVAAAAYYRFNEGLQSGWDLDVVPNLKLG
jgi:N6-L-threonylcarbamoyladenine synthase